MYIYVGCSLYEALDLKVLEETQNLRRFQVPGIGSRDMALEYS